MVQSGHPSGITYVQAWRTNTGGVMVGTAPVPNTIANDTTLSARRLKGIVSFDMPDADRVSINFRSEDAVAGSRFFGPSTAPAGTMGSEVIDAVLRAMAEGSLVDETTVDGWTFFGSNNLNPVPSDMGVCVSRQLQSRDTGTDGSTYWMNEMYRVQMSMKSPTASFQSVAEASIGLAAVAASKFPNGAAFDANQSFYDNKTYALQQTGSYPISFTTWVADGAAVVFTLPWLPISSVVTLATAPNFMTINGTETAPASINTTTGVVTLSAAGSAQDVVSIMYATNFVASP